MKNILYIMTDQQRFDTIGMVQCGREVSPNLNKLAKKSMVFNRAYTTCPLCIPARTALATGIYPTKTNVVYNDWKGVTAKKLTPIHSILKEAGYRVGHVGLDQIQVDPSMANREYDFFESQKEYLQWLKSKNIQITPSPGGKSDVTELIDGNIVERSYINHKVFLWDKEYHAFKDRWFCDRSLDFLEQNSKAPFALFTYFFSPHPPYKIPEPFYSMYDPEKVTLPNNIGIIGKGEPALRRQSVPAQLATYISPEEWKKTWAAYLGLVTLIDELIGELLNKLESCGHADNTTIIFTSDHGDQMGTHQMSQKMEMYEDSVHIPLLIHDKCIPPKNINHVVSHLDIVPTILDFCNLPNKHFLGHSLLSNDKITQPIDPCAFIQYSGNPFFGTIRRAIVTQRYKYIYDDEGNQELYDLEKDFFELHNIAYNDKYLKISAQLHAQCKDFHLNQNDFFNWN